MNNRFVFIYFLSLNFIFFSSCKNEPGSGSEGKLFSKVEPDQSGIHFNNLITETPREHIYTFNYIYNGAGVGIADFDNDGLQDIYFVGNQVSDKLYRNKGGLKFEDVSEAAGIAKNKGWRSGVTIVDINCDGYMDIYVTRGGYLNIPDSNSNLLYINQKNMTFTEEAARYGLADPGYSIAACFFDYDYDGDLDLYLTNRPERWAIMENEVDSVKKNFIQNKVYDPLVTDKLYRNKGNGTFEDVSLEAEIYPNYGYGLSCTAGDLNSDGFQDLYVANDFIENDYMYINFGDGKFKNMVKQLTNHVPYYSMGVDFGDINNDLKEEIITVEMRPDDYKRSKTTMPNMQPEFFDQLAYLGFHMQYMHNVLQFNNGNGFFSDISQLAGVDKTDWSWAALLADLDQDGFKDLYVTNGYRRDVYDRDSNDKMRKYLKDHNNVIDSVESVLGILPSVKLVNYIYKNQGDLTFKKMMKDWGIEDQSFSNGAALGDLDNDGDLDLVVNNVDDPAFLYENNINGTRNYLRIACKGAPMNTTGEGAKVTIYYEGKAQFVQVRSTRGYLSASEPYAHFGLDQVQKVDKITVQWPDFTYVEVTNVPANQVLNVDYSTGQKRFPSPPKLRNIFSESTEQKIDPIYHHVENVYDDYKNQILLPQRMSRLGPFISVADVNGDGKEDFFIGGPRKKSGAVYFQADSGKFVLQKQNSLERDKDYEDMQSIFFDADGDGDKDLYVVSGGTEMEYGHLVYQDRLYFNNGKGIFQRNISAVPRTESSGSLVMAYDFDGDGDQDIIRGGRVIPDKYPYAPRSYYFENNGSGVFSDVTEQKAAELKEIGMVTGGALIDLNADQQLDLVLVGEWMPLTFFLNNKGTLTRTNSDQYGLTQTEGWWNTIMAVDFDHDGDMDLLGGNLGLNYKFHASPEKPFMVYCDDYDKNGTYDIVLAKYNGGDLVPVRGKQCSSEQVPEIGSKFPNYNSFANATIKDIYGEGLDKGLQYKAYMFESMIFQNEGGKFKPIPFIPLAQFSTIQAFASEDFTGDGHKDLVFAGNMFNSEIETTRADAGVGMFFKGTKDGIMSFPIAPLESGFFVPYDVKDIKAVKVDGKYGILVANNNNALYYFQNIY